MSTIVSKFRSRAVERQDNPALIFLQDGENDELRLTFAELDRRACSIAARLQELAATGERALLLYAPGVDYVTAFFGCLYAGVVAVPAYPPDPSRLQRSLPRLLATVADSRCKFLLTTNMIASLGQAMLEFAPALREMTWITSDTLELERTASWRAPSLSGSDLAFLQYTSGSTGNPRGVMLTHENLLHNVGLIASSLELRPDTVGASWLPPYHDMGLIGAILCPLIHGGPLVLMSPLSFLQRPLRWLQAISKYGAAASGGPNFAFDLCVRRVTPEQAAQLDLSRWRTAFTGAEPIRRDTLEAFAKHFAASGFKQQAFYPCYGLAEATLIVSGTTPGSGAKVFAADSSALLQNFVLQAKDTASVTHIVGCGAALGGQKLVIVDPSRLVPVPDASVGEIWVSGPSVAPGYWERADESLGTFRAHLHDGTGPFLRTGDLGFLREGQLFITGRLKDLIIIRGANHYPQDIERTVEASHPRLRKGCSVAFSFKYEADEHVVVVAEVERRDQGARTPTDSAAALMEVADSPLVLDEISNAVRAAVTLQHQLQVHSVVLIEARTLPKTSSGKVQRHATRAAYMAKTLTELARNEVKLEGAGRSTIRPANTLELVKLAEREQGIALVTMVLVGDIARTLNVRRSEIDPARPVNSFGLDSLLSVELTHTLERSLGVVFPATHFLREASLKDLAGTLYELVVDDASPPSSSLLPASPAHERLLSRGQAALWLMHSVGAGAAYNLATAFRVRSTLDIECLRQSFHFVVSRHEILRTTYQVDETGIPKVTSRSAPLLLEVVDASQWSEQQVRRHVQERVDAPFDLENGPILRVCLLSRGPTDHVLSLVVHHIAADLWSLVVLMSELGKVYLALRAGTPPKLRPVQSSYRAFVHWQEQLLSGPETYRSWNFWRSKLPTPIPILELPLDRARPPAQSFRGASVSVPLSSELSARVRALSRALSVTPYSVLLAAFQALLARYSGQTEFVVGTPVSCRTRAGWDNTVGYFVNVLPLLTRVEGEVTGRQLALLAQASALDALEHQDYPFVSLVERLAPTRAPSRSPIFDVMFVFERPHLGAEQAVGRLMLDPSAPPAEWAGLQLEGYGLEAKTAQFDLALTVVDSDDRFSAQLSYDSELFLEQTGVRLANHFAALLEQLVSHPEANVWKLGFLSEDEKRGLVSVGPRAEPPTESIHGLIEKQVARAPDALAAVYGDQALTYGQLDARAALLAIHLRQAGAHAGSLVAICLERDSSMLVAMFAVLKCGAAYVPVDPDYPVDRQLFVVGDAQPRVLITTAARRGSFASSPAKLVCVDELRDQPIQPFRSTQSEPGALAYVIYTSGSTGKPKGVMVTHRGVVNFFAGMDQIVGRKDGAWLAITSMSFDISVLELLWTLTRGLKVVIQRADDWSATSRKSLDLGIMFWGQDDGEQQQRYQLFLEVVKRADEAGFSSVWIPERHFHAFGGNYPNPSVLAAAVAVSTKRIGIRSGSVVLPLQNPLRVAEEWAVVDNLSNGRVALSIASGWHKNDFVLAPSAFEARGKVMFEGIDLVRHLWQGGSTELPNGKGEATTVRTLPRPVQKELPIWLTAAGRVETFRSAGERGFNILTHLLGQDIPTLSAKIAAYHEARQRAGHAGPGQVTLMLHTFVHEDIDYVRRVVREPFTRYLEQSVDLFTPLYRELGLDPSNLSAKDKQTLLEFAFERYFSSSGLFGTPSSCRDLIAKLADAGVNEIACMVEFGVDSQLVLDGLRYLTRLLERDDSFAAQVRRHGITHLQCTPSTARMLVDTGGSDALCQLDTLLVGGEALPGRLAHSLAQQLPRRVTNMYGPTETTIWSSSFNVREPFDAVTSIGSPLRNTTMYVVDEHLELVPPGVRGELCIGGDGVAQGYFRRPELTAERFVPDRFGAPGARAFRTGDIVRRLADGTFQFLGRCDHQVKVRGFRVELGEIESALERHPSIASAVTLVQSDRSGDQRLVAYVVGSNAANTAPNPATLREFLSASLPSYMVPSAFVTLKELPRTPNGKVDRKALRPLVDIPAAAVVPPRDSLEQALCLEWSDVLGVAAVGIDDDFFSLGGHSLMATRLRSRIADHFGVELAVADLFRATTVRSLADLLRPHHGVSERAALLVEVMGEGAESRSAD
ncbi:MAG TPA: MupA/Atu3671 family FMN-dependent luciferase-like monooxygenase [Polyangiaceae bacterium]|nr:MupA/Atu3671 family FMN-dependent luciferase-like monooxygenase [Polyangiaceae bacterium]